MHKRKMFFIRPLLIFSLGMCIALPAMAGNGYGPGEGDGTGDKPQDGTGYGPGDCSFQTSAIPANAALLVKGGNGNGGGNGSGGNGSGGGNGAGNGDQDKTQDRDRLQDRDGSCRNHDVSERAASTLLTLP